MISSKTLKTLEYDQILSRLSQYCVNPEAQSYTLTLMPYTEYEAAEYALSLTQEADEILYRQGADPIVRFDSIESVLQKAPVQSTLTISEILRTARLLRASRIFRATVEEVNVENIEQTRTFARTLYVDQNFEKYIEKCFLGEDEVSDEASDALRSIRKRIRRCNEEIKETLAGYIHAASMQKIMQDNLVTIRNGRYVIPVKAEFKGAIAGLIHDQSATGATVFIEPISIVEANNNLRTLQLEEQAEIERILKDFTFRIGTICSVLETNLNILKECDLYFAKARYAHAIKAVRPKLNSSGEIEIRNGRHPLISTEKVVPVTVKLGCEYRMLIITGPNTGGKTVTLKLTGLLCLMAMSGMFLPCGEESKVSVFHQIYCDIGDEQSIAQSLSTFSSHIKNISYILDRVDAQTLVLLDEVGAGTDPAEGSALALSIASFLTDCRCKGILTTHYSELKEFALITDAVENASMQFDPNTFAPTYKLNIGIPGSSNAIEIAKRLNLNPDVVEKARQFVRREKVEFEQILQNAERARFQAEESLAEFREKSAEYDRKLAEVSQEKQRLVSLRENLTRNAKAESKRIIQDAVEEAEGIVVALKELFNQDVSEQTLFEARQLKKRLEKIDLHSNLDEIEDRQFIPIKQDQVRVGMKVYIKSLQSQGYVRCCSPEKNEYKVMIGNIETTVRLKDLFHTTQDKSQPTEKSAKRTAVAMLSPAQNSGVLYELKLLGNTVDEALPKVDAFLDSVYLSGLHEAKIIHGVGTGVLMKAVQGHLRNNQLVESYRFGRYGEGERGVTIVTLVSKK